MESVRPQQSTVDAMALQKQEQAKAKRLPAFLAAAAVLLAAGGAGAWYYVSNLEYVDANTSFAKAQATTTSLADAVATIGFEGIPEPEPVVTAPAEEQPTTAGSRGGSSRGSSSSSTSSGSSRPTFQLGGNTRRDQ